MGSSDLSFEPGSVIAIFVVGGLVFMAEAQTTTACQKMKFETRPGHRQCFKELPMPRARTMPGWPIRTARSPSVAPWNYHQKPGAKIFVVRLPATSAFHRQPAHPVYF